MIISDLMHFEEVSESPDIVGGIDVTRAPYSKVIFVVNSLSQLSTSKSTALTFSGDATAIANAINSGTIQNLFSGLSQPSS